MFLFYLLGVGLPCPSIFCQFWLCEEAQCVYLRRHLGSYQRKNILRKEKNMCKGPVASVSMVSMKDCSKTPGMEPGEE